MGSDGGKGPKPYVQRQAGTIFLRVPAGDWIAVKRGAKKEFRGSPGAVSGLKWVETPTPVVIYRFSKTNGYDSALAVLEDRWQEPLGAITPESLEREGFPTFAHFRSYWVQREGKYFRPDRQVTCFIVRPWREDDSRSYADRLLRRLYGNWLPET